MAEEEKRSRITEPQILSFLKVLMPFENGQECISVQRIKGTSSSGMGSSR